MKIQRVRGTRDFYPEDVGVRNAIFDAWRRVSLRNGFAEYDGPLLEHLDLYRAKSGDEIVGQLFTIQSRGGEELAIRPEMTPTLARMINARVQSLPRPIKWFTIGPFYRGERPQRGRLREFYQWNIDVIGSDDPIADAECLFVAVDFLRELGLTPQEVVLGINDRRLMTAIFSAMGIPAVAHGTALSLVDKAEKIGADKFSQMWDEALGPYVPSERIRAVLAADSISALRSLGEQAMEESAVAAQLDTLERLFQVIQYFGISEYCTFSPKVVRGLAYYTGMVFEGFDRQGRLRALCGGGRYDGLLAALGGPPISGVGFGMGDVVLTELLSDLGRTPVGQGRLDIFIIAADEEARVDAIRLVASLRGKGISTDFAYRCGAVGKQMATASARGASRCVIVGEETRQRRAVTVKDMATGKQWEHSLDAFQADPMGRQA